MPSVNTVERVDAPAYSPERGAVFSRRPETGIARLNGSVGRGICDA